MIYRTDNGSGLVSFRDLKNIQNEVFSGFVLTQYIVYRNTTNPVPDSVDNVEKDILFVAVISLY